MNNEKFLVRGTLVLTASTIIVKILSAAYKIPLTRILGPEGMGIFTSVFSMFMPFYAFSIAGIVPSISKITAEIHKNGDGAVLALKNKASKIFTSLAIVMAGVIILFGYFNLLNEGESVKFIGLLLLIPNLFFAVSEAIYKGLNQGRMNMIITAKAGIIESVSKLVIGLLSILIASYYFKENLLDIQLLLTLFTISISGYICKAYMKSNFYYTLKVKNEIGISVTNEKIIKMALPIAFSALVVSGAGFFDNIVGLSLIENISNAEYIFYYSKFDLSLAEDIPLWLFGIYNGYTLTIANLIPTISSAIGQSSLPVITKARLTEDSEKMNAQIKRILKMTGASIVPVSMFCFFFANDIMVILFSDMGSATDIAAMFLKFLAPFIILSAFSFPLNSILHAFDKPKSVFKILFFASIVKMSLTYFLSSIPSINIKGFIYSSCVFYILIFVLTIASVKKTKVKLPIIKAITMPLISSYISISLALYISENVLYLLPIILKIGITGFIYLMFYSFILLVFDFLA